MNILLPVASGKGGVGKTVFSANLGIALARLGKTVILVDLDLGGSNLHTCLGVPNRNPGIGGFISRSADRLESLLVETDQKRLYFIPGDSLLPGAANLQFFTKQKILKELEGLVADYTILDLGSGSAYNTVDFFIASSRGVIVTTSEITSILNAYSFLKTALFRLFLRSFPQKSEQRRVITEFVSKKTEGTGKSFRTLVEMLRGIDPVSARTAETHLSNFLPRVVLNRGKGSRDLELGHRLREVVTRNLDIGLEYVGFLPYDEGVERSIYDRKPLMLTNPASPFAHNVQAVARRLTEGVMPEAPRLFSGDGDLEELGADTATEDRYARTGATDTSV